MKRLNTNALVDIQQELSDMIDYTLITWDGNKEDLIEIVTQGFNAGYAAANNWINEYGFSSFVSEWMDQREQTTSSQSKSDMLLYDDVTKVAKNFMMHASNVKQLVLQDWSYDKHTSSLTTSLKSQLNNPKVLPKGWDKVKKSNKSAFEYFDHFDLDEDQQFKGYNSDSAGAPGFHERINLANSFYGDTEQGRTPLYTLVSSAFAHGLTMREHNNTYEVFQEAKKIKAQFDKEEFNKPIFIEDLTALSDNLLFKALMIDKYAIDDKREYHSQEELEAYLKEKNENKYIYGVVQWSMLGSDDYYHEGFTIQKIFTLEHLEQKIKQQVDSWFSEDGGSVKHKEIYYSDNNFSTVSKEEVLSSLTFKQISQKEFNAIQKVLGNHDRIQFGDHKDFMNYEYPTKEEMVAYNAQRMKAMLASLKSGETSPAEKASREERDNSYNKVVLNLLGIKQNKKNKLK